jgi:hypothetical protein
MSAHGVAEIVQLPLERKRDARHIESMKAIVLGFVVAFCAVMGVQAQPVKVKLFTEKAMVQSERSQLLAEKSQLLGERMQFLPQEPMMLLVRVYNYSGETLVLGQRPDWISFNVEPVASKAIVRQTSDPDVVGAFELETGMMATKRVNLTPHFELNQSGRYKVTAVVNFGRAGEMTSEPLMVDIVSGTLVWEREFGVPSTTGQAPEVRKYQLLQARQADAQQLYIKVTDAYGSKTFGLNHLGQLVVKPQSEQQTDRNNRLHVLHQSGRSSFTYSMVDYDGRVLLRQRYDYGETRPKLTATDVLVTGGTRTKSVWDIDPLAEEQEKAQAQEQEKNKTTP